MRPLLLALLVLAGCPSPPAPPADLALSCLPRLSTCTGMEQCCAGLVCVAVNGRATCCQTAATVECDAGMCCPPRDM